MRCSAISWRNPDGVHRPSTDGLYLWLTGPELIDLSIDLYIIGRRQRQPPFYDCDALDSAALDELRLRVRLSRRFGDVFYRTAPPFRPITNSAAGPPSGLALFGGSVGSAPAIEVFTQGLTSPVEQIQVTGEAT